MATNHGQWSENDLKVATMKIKAKKLSMAAASKQYNIPRTTLRRYLNKNQESKIPMGRKTVLTPELENYLESRIFRLADVGFPLTGKSLRRIVFEFCDENDIITPFNDTKKAAGKDWLRGFLRRHPDVHQRRAKNLNEARARKLNRTVVSDYFDKLKNILIELDIIDEGQHIYNMDEKGIRLCLHKSPKVLAKKAVKRVHSRGKEHDESVSIVSCGNAMGTFIPPFVIYKGKRKNFSLKDSLPPGSDIEFTEKGSMTADVFVKFINHFAKFKTEGKTLLIMDGAKCHLDLKIAKEAEKLGIDLLCLPSNTTHELQPMDKTVFRPLEIAWDEEVQLFWSLTNSREQSKYDFTKIFRKAWMKAATAENLINGFKTCGICPFDPSKISKEAYAPSDSTFKAHSENQPISTPIRHDSPISRRLSVSSNSSSSSGSIKEYKKLLTPQLISKKTNPRKKALNHMAVRVTKTLFPDPVIENPEVLEEEEISALENEGTAKSQLSEATTSSNARKPCRKRKMTNQKNENRISVKVTKPVKEKTMKVRAAKSKKISSL